MAVYGNVNVKYAPCKSVAQLHSAADYILGKKKEQLSSSVIKTKSELYNAFGCNRDNFANSVLMTGKCIRRSIAGSSRGTFWHRSYQYPFIRRTMIS